ncbi:DivIVA domain-containing protein [Corynebacterium sp.]|uniref:DivIVA domain-containing protein n=1 Tax=Corynebacterium sp. TaxID=1720 RepID=UPI0026DB14D7|nr:DivIVA domain-containing protein [Corynebacterium sp.]MDO5032023.1 DivIVA domain-containing protein [Corynebacterium sp.]
MLSWIVLIVVLAALVVLGTWLSGRLFGRTTVMEKPDEARNLMEDNRAALEAGHWEKIRFDVVTRGYRQDQVDDLLTALEERLRAESARD